MEMEAVLPNCPKCTSEYTYADGVLFICPECSHEWSADEPAAEQEAGHPRWQMATSYKTAIPVTVIKDLKVKGSSSLVVKVGTKVKNIRLVDGDHDIDC